MNSTPDPSYELRPRSAPSEPQGPDETDDAYVARRTREIAAEVALLETPERLARVRARWQTRLARADAKAAQLQARKPFARARSSRAQLDAENEARALRKLLDETTKPPSDRDAVANLDLLSALQNLVAFDDSVRRFPDGTLVRIPRHPGWHPVEGRNVLGWLFVKVSPKSTEITPPDSILESKPASASP